MSNWNDNPDVLAIGYRLDFCTSGLWMHALRFVESYMDAWNHGDAKGVADHLAADGVYRDIPLNLQQSHDELITLLSDFFSNTRQRYELIGEIMTAENTLAYQYRIHSLETVKKTENHAPVRGAEFMTFHGDAAMTITDYYDVPGMARPTGLADFTESRVGQHKYAKSGLNIEQMQEYKQRLDHIMNIDQAYLRPELTLPKLAEAVDCSVNHLSQVINSGFGMSFFDYLNQHRIGHARKLLSIIDDRNGAILNVAFTVGFNSNSAFYAAFKKCVGQTPAQYRRTQARRSH